MPPRFQVLATLLFSLFSFSSVRADIIIDDFDPAANDRFTNSASFLLDGHDLSGIGQDASGKWATAISRNVVVSASHFAPSGSISFYPGNDPTAPPVTRTVVSGMKVGSTDLYLAVVDATLPNFITHYNFAREFLTGTPPGTDPPYNVDSAGSFDGLTAYLFGRSPVGHAATHDQAVGQNKVSGYSENVPFLGNVDNDSILFAKDTAGDPDHVPYEAKFAGGDSGGPTFVKQGGELLLLGTNAFIYGYDPTTMKYDFTIEGNGSGINYIGNQAASIDAFIALHAVPEPGAGVLVSLSVLLLVGCRGRGR